MSHEELVSQYRSGQIARRSFVRALAALAAPAFGTALLARAASADSNASTGGVGAIVGGDLASGGGCAGTRLIRCPLSPALGVARRAIARGCRRVTSSPIAVDGIGELRDSPLHSLVRVFASSFP